MWKNYLAIAWRTMTRHKLYTLINVIGLAVGICSCLAIWAITHYELSFDKFHPDRDRIFRLVSHFKDISGGYNSWNDVPEPTADQLRIEISGLESVVHFHDYNASVTITDAAGKIKKIPAVTGNADNQDLIFAEPNYFDLFKYQWVAGSPAALAQPFTVVLTTSEIERYFGTTDYPSVMGHKLIYSDSINVTISGIVKDFDQPTDFVFKDFISYATVHATGIKDELQITNWGNYNSNSQVFVKLARGTTQARVEAQLKPFGDKHMTFDKKQDYHPLLQPLSVLHYDSEYGKDYGTVANLPTLYGLMGIAVFILLLASINFINLSTAQSLRRAKEIGIRKVMGSRRFSLILQFLGETALLVGIALALSLALLYPLLGAFSSFVPAGVRSHLFNPAIVGFGAAVLILTSVLSGLYPAWILSSFLPAKVLKSQGGSAASVRNRFGKGLVVFQFTISIVFVIATIVVSNQMHYLLNKDMGFARNAIIQFTVNQKDSLNLRRLLRDRVAALPGVERVSLDYCAPARSGWWKTTVDYKGAHPYKENIHVRAADTNYIPLYQLRLLAGHNLETQDTTREVVINDTYAKLLGFARPEQAIGVILPLWDRRIPIVGVVADFSPRSLQFGIDPLLITQYPPSQNDYSVKLQTQGENIVGFTQTIKRIETALKSVFPDETFSYTFVDDRIAKFYEKEKKTGSLINLAMAITIFISCMGLFGLAALTAEQRTKEIGIRKVLGARVTDITAMLSRDFTLLVVIALLISSPIAWYFMHGWLQDYTNRITISWWIFALAGICAVLIALLTVSFHAIRAALANPVKALRSE